MITLEHVSKIFAGGTVALRDVSLSVKRGEVVTLLGRSGAGEYTHNVHLTESLRLDT